MSSKTLLRWIRGGSGVIGIFIGASMKLRGSTDAALAIAILLLGCFILAHFLLDLFFWSTLRPSTETATSATDSALREYASVFAATSGVVLGLLSVFDKSPSSITIKVAAVALVVDILIGLALVAILIQRTEPNDGRTVPLIAILFNLALWSLALGLLCLAMAVVYR